MEEGLIFSFSFFIFLLVCLKAKLASITVTIDINKRPETPINCSTLEGSESPCKKNPKTNQEVAAAISGNLDDVRKYQN